jgi:hypothetical protein
MVYDVDFHSSLKDILSVTTSVHTHSVFFLAKRTRNSKPEKIFVRTLFPQIGLHVSTLFFADVNWTGRGGNVSSTAYNT